MPESAISHKPSSRHLTALVAGGAGFLGSHLCEILLGQNIRVIAVDNLQDSGKENIKPLLHHSHFTLVDFDLNSGALHLGEETQIDYIFHAAGVEEKLGKADLSLETLLVNSLGTKNLLDLARTQKAKFLLISSADIYSGALSSTSLNYYFGRFEREEKVLTHHEAKRYAEALTFEYYKKYNVDARICRVLDIYGPRLNLANGETLNTLIKEALTADQLTVEGDGLKTLHPTYVSDVVYGLIKAVLVENTKGKIFHLINPQKITVLGLVEELRRAMGKNFDILFKKEPDMLSFPYHTLEVDSTIQALNWRPKVSLIDGLITTIESFRKPETATIPDLAPLHPTPPKNHRPKINLKKWIPFKKVHVPRQLSFKGWQSKGTLRFTIFLASLMLLLLGVFYPLLSFFFSLNSGQFNLAKAYQSLQGGELAVASKSSLKAELSYRRAGGDLRNLTWLLSLLGLRSKAGLWDQELFALENLAKANLLTASGLAPLELVRSNLATPQEDFASLLAQELGDEGINLALAADRLAVAEATLLELERKGGTEFLTKEVKSWREKIPQGRNTVNSLRNLYQVLPGLVGIGGSQHYLLIEADATLRSSLGKFQNYLLVTFDNGVLKKTASGSFTVLNNQIPDQPPAPAEIRDLLGRDNFFIGESVWEVDLPTALKPLENAFVRRGQPLSGVAILGPGLLTQLNGVMGEKNLANNFYEGLINLSTPQWGQVLKMLKESAQKKQSVLVALDESYRLQLEGKMWSGEVADEKLTAQELLATAQRSTVVADYLQVVTDSFGSGQIAAPALNYTLQISNQGLLEGTLTLNYDNQGEEEFTGFTRVLVPLGSVLETRQVGGGQVAVDQKEEKTQFGIPVRVAAGTQERVQIKYQIPLQISRGNPTTYSILIQKQLGTGNTPYQIQVNLPTNIEAGVNPGFTGAEGRFELKGNLEMDKVHLLEMNRS